jgi:TctA family transporter
MACIAGIVRIFMMWRFTRHYSHYRLFPLSWLLLPVYLLLLWQLKYYYLAALLPALLAFFITDTLTRVYFRKNILRQISVLVAVFAGILLISTFFSPQPAHSLFPGSPGDKP